MPQEEILIRMGLDQRAVINGLQTLPGQFQQFGTKLTSDLGNMANNMAAKLTSMLRANLYLAGATLLKQLADEFIPTAQEFWDEWYGVSPTAAARFDRLRNNLKALRGELLKLRAEVDESWWRHLFGTETDEGKRLMLEKKALEIIKEQSTASWELARAQRWLANATPGSAGQVRLLEDIANAKKKLLALELESLKVAKEEAAVRKAIADAEAAKDWSDRRADEPLPAWTWPVAAGPLSPAQQVAKQRMDALRSQMVSRFGDPTQPGYRDPNKVAESQAQVELAHDLKRVISPSGALWVEPKD